MKLGDKALNYDGQPLNRLLNYSRICDRKVDELIGISKGVLADGSLLQSEVEFIYSWMVNNREISHHWPLNVLYARIQDVLEDGVMDSDEEKLLLETLLDLTGGPAPAPEIDSMSTALPLCDPQPVLNFEDSIYCFTGKFATGSRAQVESSVESLGARTKRAPTRDTNYLVIGAIGSRDWIHSTHGRKIEKAVELRDSGLPISIISEEHWVDCIKFELDVADAC